MSIVVQERPALRNWSGNFCNYKLYSAAAAGDPTIYFEVRLMFRFVSTSFTEIVRLPFTPVDGVANVNFQYVLDGLLNGGVPVLQGDETLPTVADEQTGYFFISFREITGTPTSFDDSEVDFERFIIKGGIDFFKWQGNNYWQNLFDVQKPFLTWQESGRLAGPLERMYLAWLNHTAVSGTDLKALITVHYTDGGATRVINTAFTDIVPGKVIYIPTGYTQLDLASLEPTRIVYYWVVKVMDHTNPGTPVDVSEEFTYYLDFRQDYNGITLNYRNSLGGLDSLRVRGVVETLLKYENEQQSTVTPANYYTGSKIKPIATLYNNKEMIGWKGDAGWVTKPEQDRLRDALLNREVLWERSLKWVPVLVVSGDFKLRSSEDQLFSFPIEFMLAHQGDRFYTPDDAGLGNTDFNTNVCNGTISGITVTFPDAPGSYTTMQFTCSFAGGNTQFTYQVIGIHPNPITANTSAVPITVTGLTPLAIYSLELRALCANGALGKKYVTAFAAAAGLNSSVKNNTALYEVVDVKVDTVVELSTNLPVGNIEVFNYAGSGVHDVQLLTTNGPMSVAVLYCAAGTFYATVSGTQADWTGIDITGGFDIEFF